MLIVLDKRAANLWLPEGVPVVDAREPDVFLDVCTQRDFLSPDGARPIRNPLLVAGNIKRLMAFARCLRVPTLSCVELHRFDEVRGRPNPVCVAGTRGQQKLTCSVLPRRVVLESDNFLCVPLDIFHRYQQAIVTKSPRDPFANPKLDRLLTELPARRFVLFGVALETNLRLLSLGLLLRHRRVTLISDACGYWNDSDADMTLRQLSAKGCELLTAREFIDQGLNKRGTRHVRLRHRSVA